MKDWREARGCEKPEEFDTTSSPTTVYQRRNIEKVIEKDMSGNEVVYYKYDERTMTHDEYSNLKSSDMRSVIEYIAFMTGVDLEGGI
jgi:hypothetical protein